jgi:hypothetical protein
MGVSLRCLICVPSGLSQVFGACSNRRSRSDVSVLVGRLFLFPTSVCPLCSRLRVLRLSGGHGRPACGGLPLPRVSPSKRVSSLYRSCLQVSKFEIVREATCRFAVC